MSLINILSISVLYVVAILLGCRIGGLKHCEPDVIKSAALTTVAYLLRSILKLSVNAQFYWYEYFLPP